MTPEPRLPPVTFLGLGAMGEPMARRLIEAGYPLTCFDVREERVRALVSRGAEAGQTPEEAVEGSKAVFIMVATPEQAEEVLFGDAGAAKGLKPGMDLCVMSTVGPVCVQSIAGRLAAGVGVLDAPVSGGVARAATGDLVIMTGGANAVFARLEPPLGCMGSVVLHCGGAVGDGQSVKLVNQLLAGVHIAVAAEAIAFASAAGLDPSSVFEVVRQGAAGSFMLNDRGSRMLDRDFTPARSALDLFVKDMGLVLDVAEQHRVPCPIAAAVRQLFIMGSSMGWGQEDDSGLLRVYERWSAQRGATT